jgi:hypothetical protein
MGQKKPGITPKLIGTRVTDYTGTKVGTLLVKTYLTTKATGNERKLNVAQWECECENCGTIQVKSRRQIFARTARCVSCSRRIQKPLVGKKFGRWEVVALAPTPPEGYTESYWQCRCECGTWRVLRRSYLASGDSKSCGCLFDEVNAAVMRKARKARWGPRRKST